MEHTNLFLYEDKASLDAKYPASKVDDVVPGVAYGRADVPGDFDYKVIYNKKKVTYSITVHPKDESGETIGADFEVTTPETVEGHDVNVVIVPEDIAGYKAVPVKITVAGNAEYDLVYSALI